ncbi:acetyltransferase [Undibacterium sp. KW1]|uniref:GNAT family N-acetyltransferase n=1 Tax=Undibacterium sp. KW1 TaxID=2058624 RepID=UPI001331F8E8|nr:GNAT family N-acetyltransferase [Undibacterium sp. KW1]BBB59560.1 acetyltransferase [Undibacterium sp. KW1]
MMIERVDPASEAAGRLIAMSDAYMAALYPAESNHMLSVDALRQDNVIFLGCYMDGQLAACGAVTILFDDDEQLSYGEIKRVFVPDEFRGRGLSKHVMRALEDHLLDQDIRVVRLETGIRQPEALGLYFRLGYAERAAFGQYEEDPLSVFMEKILSA